MTSTAMARRQREGGTLAEAARLELLLERVAPGGRGLDLRRLREALGLLVDEARWALEAADDAHREEEREGIGPRERHDGAAGELHRRLVAIRTACESVYGPGGATRCSGSAAAPRVVRRSCLRGAERPLPSPAGLAPRPDRGAESGRGAPPGPSRPPGPRGDARREA